MYLFKKISINFYLTSTDEALKAKILPLATVATPNYFEACTLAVPASRGVRAWWRRLMGADGPRPGEPATLTYYALLLATLFLLLFGLVMVFSVQSVTVAAQGQDTFTEFAKYLIFAVVGLAGMAAIAHASVRFLKRMAIPTLNRKIGRASCRERV